MSWQFEWRRTWPEVWEKNFQQIWTAFLECDPHAQVYHRPEIIRAWAETEGERQGARPMFGLATDVAANQVLLPWVVVAHRGRLTQRRVLEPAGQSLFGYQDPMTRLDTERIDWAGLWDACRQQAGAFSDQARFRLVHSRYAKGACVTESSEESPVLELEGLEDLPGALARCSPNHRGDVRRRLRRLEETGEVTLWVPAAHDVERALIELETGFFPAYDALWSARPEGSLFERSATRDLVRRVVSEGLAGDFSRFAVLKVGGASVAWLVALFHRSEIYWWIPTYDPKWERFSPGKVLLAKLIEHAIANGWKRLHFLTGGQSYKKAWKPRPTRLCAIRWHAPHFRGWLMARYDSLVESGTLG